MGGRSRPRRRIAARRVPPGTHARRDGFTLISVIIAMMLLSVGVLALAGATQVSMGAVNSENTRNVALQLARSYLEQVRGRDAALLVTEPDARIDETGAANAAGRFRRTLTVEATADSALVRVRVNVSAQSGAWPVVMETLVFRPTP